MAIPQHVEHFTSVLNRMDGYQHLRRIVVASCGLTFWSGKTTTMTASGASRDCSITKAEVILTNAFARGSDALFDAGSVECAIDQMKADPLMWGHVWHVQADDERWDTLSEYNVQAQNLVSELARQNRIGDPLDVVRFKLMGVYVADALDRATYAQRGLAGVNDRAFTVSRGWLRRALTPQFFCTVSEMVAQDVAEAMDAYKKRATH